MPKFTVFVEDDSTLAVTVEAPNAEEAQRMVEKDIDAYPQRTIDASWKVLFVQREED